MTGGAGFIGSHVVDRLLAEGHDVRVLDSLDPQVHDGRPEHLALDAELVVADIRDAEAVRRALGGIDRLVHLAAAVGVGQSMYELVHYTTVNAVGTAVLLEEGLRVRDRLEKIVVASSMSIYGEGLYRCPAEEREIAAERRPDEQLAARRWEPLCPSCGRELEPVATPESKPVWPASVYAIGKRDQEELTLTWGAAYRVPATALRFFNVYGPRQSLSNPYTGVAAIFASRLMNGRSPVVYEDGGQMRDFVHVSDIAGAVVAAGEPKTAVGEAVNVATGRGTSVLDVARTLADALGVDVEPDVQGAFRPGDVRHCFADVRRAGAHLGYEPRVAFADGMRELVAWLAGQPAVDRLDEATRALSAHGLVR